MSSYDANEEMHRILFEQMKQGIDANEAEFRKFCLDLFGGGLGVLSYDKASGTFSRIDPDLTSFEVPRCPQHGFEVTASHPCPECEESADMEGCGNLPDAECSHCGCLMCEEHGGADGHDCPDCGNAEMEGLSYV